MAKAATTEKTAPKPEKASKVSRGVVAKKTSNDEDDEDKARERKYPEILKIKILNKENPHREGSKRAEAFTALQNSKTMGDYYATGHKIKYIQGWIESGHMADFADV